MVAVQRAHRCSQQISLGDQANELVGFDHWQVSKAELPHAPLGEREVVLHVKHRDFTSHDIAYEAWDMPGHASPESKPRARSDAETRKPRNPADSGHRQRRDRLIADATAAPKAQNPRCDD